MNAWYDTGLAGPWGTFSLAFFPIVASAIGELVVDRKPDARFAITGPFVVILGAAWAASFAVLAVCAAAAAVMDRKKIRIRL